MATRTKTAEFAFPPLASLTEAAVTNLTQITVYLPESGKTFRSVRVIWSCDDIITATGGTITEYRTGLRLGAAAYTTVTNTNDITHSGENMSPFLTADLTSHFSANWSGTSMTCDLQAYADQSTGTTLNFVNVSATLEIAFDYDDTSQTQIKTVYLPLDAPTGALATSKPGTATATIPNLDDLIENGRTKTYRDIHLVIQGNEHRNAATTDHTISFEIDAAGAVTTGSYEGALASDRWFRYVHGNLAGSFTTNATHSFYIWGSVARCNHLQVYLVVTYEVDYLGPVTTAWAASTAKSLNDRVYGTNASGKDIAFICTTAGTTGGTEPTWNTGAGATTTDGTVTWTVLSVLNSLQIPVEVPSPMGGPTSSDYQRSEFDLYIQEPGTITDDYCALLTFWTQGAAQAGLNMRVGTGSFTAYTDTASVLCGGNGAMLRCESVLSLARGKNTLQFDIYRTGTTHLGWALSALWMINYTSAQHKDGAGAHKQTRRHNICNMSTVAAAIERIPSAFAPVINEANYFLDAVGVELLHQPNALSVPNGGIGVQVERLSSGGEGGIKWEPAICALSSNDAENGAFYSYGQIADVFKMWTGDPRAGRLDVETARRWRIEFSTQSSCFSSLDMLLTYHSIAFTVSGTVRGYTGSGSGITVKLFRAGTDECLMSTTTGSGGTFSFTWYDDVADVYCSAYVDDNFIGRSKSDPAGSGFDIYISPMLIQSGLSGRGH